MWENRRRNDAEISNSFSSTTRITVDGTDFPIQEQEHYPKSWYSHKFKGAGVRYEVGLSIETSDIVWIEGPYRCGWYPDIKIFKEGGLKDKLLEAGEQAEADDGYRGEPLTINLPNDGLVWMKGRKSRARYRQENCNMRLKKWGCLKQKWRHDVERHHLAFEAVAVLTQISFENGEPLSNCDYYAPLKPEETLE